MDGELNKQEASNIIEACRTDEDLQENWKTYHLIGDTLRQSSQLFSDVSMNVKQKLKAEPIVLFPTTASMFHRQKHKVFTLSIAASVVIAVSVGMVLHSTPYQSSQTIIADNPNKNNNNNNNNNNLNIVPVRVSSPASDNYPPVEINDYLFVHREFSPGTHMKGQITNVHNTEYHERQGR
jgi:sigma-E factor negative regulatory protein RseA